MRIKPQKQAPFKGHIYPIKSSQSTHTPRTLFLASAAMNSCSSEPHEAAFCQHSPVNSHYECHRLVSPAAHALMSYILLLPLNKLSHVPSSRSTLPPHPIPNLKRFPAQPVCSRYYSLKILHRSVLSSPDFWGCQSSEEGISFYCQTYRREIDFCLSLFPSQET